MSNAPVSKIKSKQMFTVEIPGKDGKIKEVTFGSEREALEALAKVELAAKAQAYVDARGLTGKDAAGKFNVVLDYLAYEAGNSTTEGKEDAEKF
jgi:hypothetical protein